MTDNVEVPIDAVLALLRGKIGEDAVSIAVLRAQVAQLTAQLNGVCDNG